MATHKVVVVGFGVAVLIMALVSLFRDESEVGTPRGGVLERFVDMRAARKPLHDCVHKEASLHKPHGRSCVAIIIDRHPPTNLCSCCCDHAGAGAEGR